MGALSKPLTPDESSDFTAGDDSVILVLLRDALHLLDHDQASARRRVEQAYSLALRPYRGDSGARGVLAPWQVRRVEAFITENLSGRLRIEAVAATVDLSPSYFSRAFKATFGEAFSQFVALRRIELAKRLLLTTNAPIAEIALACGLSDQSHLTRVFNRAVGVPPNAWRRRVRDPGAFAALSAPDPRSFQ